MAEEQLGNNMNDYILITPIKNEERFLRLLADCIINQKKRPIVWIIVDGKSVDSSLAISEKLCAEYDWIYLKRQEAFINGFNHLNFSIGVIEGYDLAKSICQKKGFHFEFVGKLDADSIVPCDFFDSLISKFEKDADLGIATAASYSPVSEFEIMKISDINESYFRKDYYLPEEMPDKRIYKRSLLEEVGGFPRSKFSPDTILLCKFKLNGWRMKTYDDIRIYNLRADSGTERDVWKSSMLLGRGRYYLNYHPIYVLIIAAYFLTCKPIYYSVGYIFGYISSMINRDEQVSDEKLRHYLKYTRPLEVLKSLMASTDIRKGQDHV